MDGSLFPILFAKKPSAAPAFDSAATAFFAAVVSAGGSVSTPRKTLYNNLYLALRAISPSLLAWDRLWIFAAENSQAALIDLIGLHTATLVNSPTVTVDRGITGDASTSYVNTNYDPTVNGVNFTQNAGHIAHYTNLAGAGGQIAGSGAFSPDTTPRRDSWIIAPTAAGAMEALINLSGDPTPVGSGLTIGMFIGDRTNSTTVLSEANSTLLGTNTPAASFVPSPFQHFVCAVNDETTPAALNSFRFAMYSVGGTFGGLSGGNAFTTAITTFLTAIGAN